MKLRHIITIFVLATQISCGQSKSGNRTQLGIEYSKSELKKALLNKKDKLILADTLISDKETAISISEAILFKIYGKENIVRQRPYEINKINEYWVVNGTLPSNPRMKGGTFLIILDSTDGQVIRLTHGK